MTRRICKGSDLSPQDLFTGDTAPRPGSWELRPTCGQHHLVVLGQVAQGCTNKWFLPTTMALLFLLIATCQIQSPQQTLCYFVIKDAGPPTWTSEKPKFSQWVEVCISLTLALLPPIAYHFLLLYAWIYTFLANENNSIQAAVALMAIRGVALYFSRPVRLFRPTKGNNRPAKKALKNLAM